MEKEMTTMNIKKSTIDRLRYFEIHPRETHEEIVLRLLDARDAHLNKEEKQNVEKVSKEERESDFKSNEWPSNLDN